MERFQAHTSMNGNKRAQGRRIKRGLEELRELDSFSTTQQKINEPSQKRRRNSAVVQPHEPLAQNEDEIIGKERGVTHFSSNFHNQLINSSDLGSSFDRITDSTFDKKHESAVTSSSSRKNTGDSSYNNCYLDRDGREDVSTVSSPHVFDEFLRDWKEAKKLLLTAHQSISNESTICGLNSKRQFLEYCELWHARSRTNRLLPAYIEATELLVQAMLVDQFQEQSSSSVLKDYPFFCSTRMVCLYYGAALSRIVHVLTGSFTKSDSLNTYRKRAKEVGLPEEVVEVRQRVAHGNIPSITELRWVASMTFQFLFQEHWISEECRYNQQLKEEQNKSNRNKKISESMANVNNLSDSKKVSNSVELQTCTSTVVNNSQRNVADKKTKTNEEKIIHEGVRDSSSVSSDSFSVEEIKSFLESLSSLPVAQSKEDKNEKNEIENNIVSRRMDEGKRETRNECLTEVMRGDNTKEASNSFSYRFTPETNNVLSKGHERESIWNNQCMGWSIL